MKKPNRTVWRGLVWLAVAVLLVFLVSSAAFMNWLDEAAAWTIHFAEARPLRGAVIFVLFSAVSAMLAFASSAVLVPPATAVWGRHGAFLLLWSGWILGAAFAYGVGRIMTPLLVRIGYGKKLVRYQRFVSGKMKFWAVLVFCFAVPSEIPGYLFGSAHYSFFKFIAAIAIAESFYAFALVLIGENLLHLKPSLGLIAVGILILVVAWLRRPRKGRAPTNG
jgi:uncharacterized membrane protein YdjX (TVP38/TMEM64 family)